MRILSQNAIWINITYILRIMNIHNYYCRQLISVVYIVHVNISKYNQSCFVIILLTNIYTDHFQRNKINLMNFNIRSSIVRIQDISEKTKLILKNNIRM